WSLGSSPLLVRFKFRSIDAETNGCQEFLLQGLFCFFWRALISCGKLRKHREREVERIVLSRFNCVQIAAWERTMREREIGMQETVSHGAAENGLGVYSRPDFSSQSLLFIVRVGLALFRESRDVPLLLLRV